MQLFRQRFELVIVLAGTVMAGCAPIFGPRSLQPETFRNGSGPARVRVSLYGNAPDVILSHPVFVGDSLVGSVPTPGLMVQVNIHVVRADSTGRMAIPVVDIRRIVGEQSEQSKANAGLLLVGLSVVALVVVLVGLDGLRSLP